MMRLPVPLRAPIFLLALAAGPAPGQDVAVAAPPGAGASTIYRQVMPDGRVVYSDKPQKGARIERTVNIEAPLKTGAAPKAGGPPPGAPQIERSAMRSDQAAPGPGPTEQAELDLMRAQMLLEQARQLQMEGVEPEPGERTANVGGGSRLNEAYWARQNALAREVAEAEAELARARAEQDKIR